MQLSSSHDAVHLVVIIQTVCNIYSESFICNTVEMTIPWSELGCKSFTFGTEYHLTEYHCTDSLLWMYIFFLSKKTFVRIRMKVNVLQITNMSALATSCEELTHWKRPWCWEGLGAGGEEDDRGWDGWMTSLTRWTWVWVNSRSWWWTGRPGMLRFMGTQRVRHHWATELNWLNMTFQY